MYIKEPSFRIRPSLEVNPVQEHQDLPRALEWLGSKYLCYRPINKPAQRHSEGDRNERIDQGCVLSGTAGD